MEKFAFVFLAALLAWLGARWSRGLPYYEAARRAIPSRTAVTVALATVGAAIGVWQSESWISAAFLSLWSVVFALIAVIDLETHFIPNKLSLPAIGAALAASFVDPRLTPLSALLGAVVGGLFFAIFYFVGQRFYRGGLGMGDVTLSFFVGAVTGLQPVLYALLAGMILSGATLLLLLALRRVTMKSYIPYGPYLCAGGWLGMLPAVLRFWGMDG